MIGDFMTKPLQGALFRKFRDQIMGVIQAQDPGQGKDKKVNIKSSTHKGMPEGRKKVTNKKKDLVPSRTGRHHRSVLGEDTKRSSNGRHKKEKVSSVTK
jgi:hypothetical protein